MPTPAGLVTATVPVAAPDGTVAVIVVAETTVNAVAIPANATQVAPARLCPRIVTVEPTGAEAG